MLSNLAEKQLAIYCLLPAPSPAQDLLTKRRRPTGMLREGRRLELIY